MKWILGTIATLFLGLLVHEYSIFNRSAWLQVMNNLDDAGYTDIEIHAKYPTTPRDRLGCFNVSVYNSARGKGTGVACVQANEAIGSRYVNAAINFPTSENVVAPATKM